MSFYMGICLRELGGGTYDWYAFILEGRLYTAKLSFTGGCLCWFLAIALGDSETGNIEMEAFEGLDWSLDWEAVLKSRQERGRGCVGGS